MLVKNTFLGVGDKGTKLSGGQGLVNYLLHFYFYFYYIYPPILAYKYTPPPIHFSQANSQVYAEILEKKHSPKVYSSAHFFYFIFKTFDSSYIPIYTRF